MTDEERGFARGARAAWIHVLNLLNTFDDILVDKTEVYGAVMRMEIVDIAPPVDDWIGPIQNAGDSMH